MTVLPAGQAPAAGADTTGTDTTGPAFRLLRELSKGQARQRFRNLAYQLYFGLFVALVYGGTLIEGVARDLKRPPAPTAQTPHILAALPAAVTALALLGVLAVARDALWRGPVTLPRPAVDWLLDTPVSRHRLLRPRYALAAACSVLAGAVAGLVPAAALLTVGLGRDDATVLRMAGAGMLSIALLAGLATGTAALIERYRFRRITTLTPAALLVTALLCGLAAWNALGAPPSALSAIALWCGPWGWAGQGLTAMAGGSAPLWPVATALLGVAAAVALTWGYVASSAVPGNDLRARARTLSAMSGALLSADTRGFAQARRSAVGVPGRARLRFPAPRHRYLVICWRDALALARAPFRLATALALALASVGLVALAGHRGQLSLLPLAAALSAGYLAAAILVEGARLDADDPRRSAVLPMRFGTLPWWHSAVPFAILLLAGGAPAVAIAIATARPLLIALAAVTAAVLVGGALVNTYRGLMPPNVFVGVETGFGNTAIVSMIVWYAWGPVLAIVPMTLLLSGAVTSASPGPVIRAVVLGAALAGALVIFATRRAERLRETA